MKQSGEQQVATRTATKSTKQNASSGTFEASQATLFFTSCEVKHLLFSMKPP